MASNCDSDGKIDVTVDYKGKCGGRDINFKQLYSVFKSEQPINSNSFFALVFFFKTGSSDGCKNNCEGLPVNYVCGGDGVTYANECQLQYEGCQSGIKTNVAYGGKCKA